jgi:hypothetical protein
LDIDHSDAILPQAIAVHLMLRWQRKAKEAMRTVISEYM